MYTLFLLSLLTFKLFAEESPKEGIFSLPSSQQPSALFGLTSNIIDEGELQLYFFADDFHGNHKRAVDLVPYCLYGISEHSSILCAFPFTPELLEGCQRSSGVRDFFIQGGYAFYNHTTAHDADQATFIGKVSIPAGSTRKQPETGDGAPTFFIGFTYNYTAEKWYAFTAYGARFPASHHRTRFGDQYFYEFGFGHTFPSPEGWIYAWILEVDGLYSAKSKIHGHLDHNSGGNVIYSTPSLWVSSKEFLLQFGVTFPIAQNLFGHQRKIDYVLNLALAWSLY